MDYQEKLEKFLEKKSDFNAPLGCKKKLIVIYWPTACWKTALSVNIAKKINSEIISTDSRQIFREANIWTAKISKEEMQGIPHHMIDIVDLNTDFSVQEFKKQAEEIMERLYKQNKIPILAWWTGLYIDALIYDFQIPEVVADKNLRNSLEEEYKKFWADYLYEKLKKMDPENYHKVHKNNIQYVIRALEVIILTGKSKYENPVKKELKYDVLFLTPYDWNREELYNRINKRVDLMFEQWLEEEIKWLIKKWYSRNSFWLKSIWYTEYFDYLDWKYSWQEMIDKIKQHSRNYAKRQLTWFRKYK